MRGSTWTLDTVTLEGAVGGPISQDLNFRLGWYPIYQAEGLPDGSGDSSDLRATTRRGGVGATGICADRPDRRSSPGAHAYDRLSVAGSAYSSDTYLGDPSIVQSVTFSTKIHDDLVGGLARAVVKFESVTLTSITGFDNRLAHRPVTT